MISVVACSACIDDPIGDILAAALAAGVLAFLAGVITSLLRGFVHLSAPIFYTLVFSLLFAGFFKPLRRATARWILRLIEYAGNVDIAELSTEDLESPIVLGLDEVKSKS